MKAITPSDFLIFENMVCLSYFQCPEEFIDLWKLFPKQKLTSISSVTESERIICYFEQSINMEMRLKKKCGRKLSLLLVEDSDRPVMLKLISHSYLQRGKCINIKFVDNAFVFVVHFCTLYCCHSCLVVFCLQLVSVIVML